MIPLFLASGDVSLGLKDNGSSQEVIFLVDVFKSF